MFVGVGRSEDKWVPSLGKYPWEHPKHPGASLIGLSREIPISLGHRDQPRAQPGVGISARCGFGDGIPLLLG